jgi:hypothetical protein
MNFLDTQKVSAVASLWFSWIAALIAFVPILLVFAIGSRPRFRYVTAGILGAIAGESCGVTSLFLSFWFYCRARPSCNTAQGDMGLLITLPLGTLAGLALSLFWTWAIRRVLDPSTESEQSAVSSGLRKWTCVAVIPVGFWLLATFVAALLMA